MVDNIKVEISAALASNFKKAFKEASNSIEGLNREIQDTRQALSAATRFTKLQNSIKKLGAETKLSKQKLDILNNTTAKAGLASERLSVRIKQASNKYQESSRKLAMMQKELSESARGMRKFGLDTRSAAKAQDRLQSELDQTISKQNRLQKKQQGRQARAGALGGLGAGALGVAAGAGFLGSAAFGDAISFESSVAELSARNALDLAQTEDLGKEIRKIAANSVFTAGQAGQAAVALGKAGFEADQIKQSLQAVVDFSTAEGVDAAFTAQLVTSTLSQFGASADQAESFLQQISKAANSAAINVVDLSESMKFLGPTAANIGVDIAEASTVVALLGRAGLRGGIATRALRTTIQRLAAPTKEMTDAFSKFGEITGVSLDFFDEQGSFVGFSRTIEQLEKATSKLNKEQSLELVSKIFGSESATQVLSLIKTGSANFDELAASIKNASEEDLLGNLKASALNTFAGQIKLVQSAFAELFITIFEDSGFKEFTKLLTRAITGIIKGLTTVLKLMGPLTGIFASAITLSIGLAGAFGAVALAMAGVGAAQAQLASAGLLTPLLAGLKSAGGLGAIISGLSLGTIISSLGIILAAVAGIIAGFQIFSKTFESLSPLLDVLFSKIGKLISGVGELFGVEGLKLIDVFTLAIEGLAMLFTKVLIPPIEFLISSIQFLINGLKTVKSFLGFFGIGKESASLQERITSIRNQRNDLGNSSARNFQGITGPVNEAAIANSSVAIPRALALRSGGSQVGTINRNNSVTVNVNGAADEQTAIMVGEKVKEVLAGESGTEDDLF